MNTRERFLATMRFDLVDHPLFWENGYWVGAVRRWYREGLPRGQRIPDEIPDGEMVIGGPSNVDARGLYDPAYGLPDFDVAQALKLDEPSLVIPVNQYLCPPFVPAILEDHGDWVLRRNSDGIVERNRKDLGSLPGWVHGPVQSREDWEQIKAERLQPTLPGRLPEDWPAWRERFRTRTYPLVIGGNTVGFYGMLRNLLGETQVLTAFYDQPDLVRDIIAHLADFWCALFDQILSQTDVDMAYIWEDMCYKTGPLISPATFREYLLPAYRQLTGCLRDHGVPVITVDTDGNCWQLLPLFIEGGVDSLLPFEVQSGMDVAQVRAAFPRLGLLGGVDKRPLAEGRAAIDRELARLAPMLGQPGFIPSVDHQVPPDVSWENMRYYRLRLNAMIMEVSKS